MTWEEIQELFATGFHNYQQIKQDAYQIKVAYFPLGQCNSIYFSITVRYNQNVTKVDFCAEVYTKALKNQRSDCENAVNAHLNIPRHHLDHPQNHLSWVIRRACGTIVNHYCTEDIHNWDENRINEILTEMRKFYKDQLDTIRKDFKFPTA